MKAVVRKPRLLREIVRAWFATLLALFPATALGVWALAAAMVLAAGDGSTGGSGLVTLLVEMAVMGVIYAIVLAPVFSLLALPFLPFQPWIVRRERPFLRPGYIAVVLYGPALLLLFNHDWPGLSFLAASACYEVIALAATLGFAWFAEPLGLKLDRGDRDVAQVFT